ncbi:Na+/H+ antiporter NhaC [Flavobacteriaceae bacterium]|nr:Na+/H+ antiporter NhaC [Flavobacteriaceae bacterium]
MSLKENSKEPRLKLPIIQALVPVFVLVALLFFNVIYAFGDDALSGSNQFLLLVGGAVAAIVGVYNGISFDKMIDEVAENIKSTTGAILILLMVGALAGTWLLSGIIPTMIYYGLSLLKPSIFLLSTVVICAIISIATGSSWTTSATVGIAMIGIANALGIDAGMAAGAVISGAYFGDKLSPMSDTTNLAPAMAGTDLFTHIKYMTYTTIPSFVITLLFFGILGLTLDPNGESQTSEMLAAIDTAFMVSPWLFVVPALVIFMIVKKVAPLIALFTGTLLAAAAALWTQPELVALIGGSKDLDIITAYKGVMNAITVSIEIPTTYAPLNDLFTSSGMAGMLGTIWLILCAMVFGGIMEAIGALSSISEALLKLFHTTFGLFASTVASCLAINIAASDQYLAIVVPGKMYAKAYKEKGLAPENLSRTLEDSGTVTSALIPWNTCGAYQSGVLGVDTLSYAGYAIFNWISPFMTLLFAAFRIKIRQIAHTK